jgi:hypothetical protein
MTPTEYRQKRLDEQLGKQEATARWRADWWASVAVPASAVPPKADAEHAETFLETLARWNRQAAERREGERAELAAFNESFNKWWNETHPTK